MESGRLLFDELLSGHLGDFGAYQRRIYVLVCLPAVYCAINSFAWTFTGADVPHRSPFHSPLTPPASRGHGREGKGGRT